MEGPKEIIERLESDVDEISKMYDLAAKVYPYENVHGGRSTVQSEHRRNLQQFETESPEAVMAQPSAMPLLFVYMMSRGGAKGPLDFSTLFKRPALGFGYLFLGTSIL